MDIAKIKLSQLAQHGDLLDRYGASIRILGHRSLVSPDVLEAIDKATEMTKHNKKYTLPFNTIAHFALRGLTSLALKSRAILNVCFPYTSRDEITTSIKSIVSLATPPMSSMKHTQHTLEPLSEETIDVSSTDLHETDENSRSASPSVSDSSLSNTTSSSTIVSGTIPSSPSSPPIDLHLTTKPITNTILESDTLVSSLLDIESITEQTITNHLFTSDNPPLDLLVRTSGVERMSDFMLWQAHQDTDIEFVDCMWPEFDIWHFLPILLNWGLKRKKFLQESHENEQRKKSVFARSSWTKGWDAPKIKKDI